MNQHVHLIGIAGSGLSAIARLLRERGYQVSGSDRQLTPLAQQLSQSGIQVFIGHAAGNVHGADVVVRSSAIADDNPEVRAALAAGIPVLKRAEFIGQLMTGQTGIAVAGTHGKTTTTAMIAFLLSRLGQDPSYIIGGTSLDLNRNAHSGRGSTFVVEADEYDSMFLGLRPRIAVVTNVEHDHPDCFPTSQDYLHAFQEFTRRLKSSGCLLLCADQPAALSLADYRPVTTYVQTYGLNRSANYRAENVIANDLGGFSFDFVLQPNSLSRLNLGRVDLGVPGMHNVVNALAALAVADQLGLSMVAATGVISQFTGTGRRFEVVGEAAGVTVISDYAHHPTAIRTTLAAARSRYANRRIWAIWQPHTYSRTQSLAKEFASAFDDADQVIVTAVYAAREAAQDYTPQPIITAMQHPSARYIPELTGVTNLLLKELQPGDVVIVLSAGDAELIPPQLLMGLKEELVHA